VHGKAEFCFLLDCFSARFRQFEFVRAHPDVEHAFSNCPVACYSVQITALMAMAAATASSSTANVPPVHPDANASSRRERSFRRKRFVRHEWQFSYWQFKQRVCF
jgi:hypothetical protein